MTLTVSVTVQVNDPKVSKDDLCLDIDTDAITVTTVDGDEVDAYVTDYETIAETEDEEDDED